jgi:hypothetical protein
MDWPVIGAVSAAVVVAGAVTFEVVVFMQSDPTPVKRAPQLASYGSSVERSAYEIPGFASRISAGRPPPATAIPKKPPVASNTVKPAPPSDPPTAPPSGETKTAKLTTPEVQPRAEQWRVVVTAKASYFNLGGHVDSSGVVDSLASSHLRDALKSHRNFPQLPPDIKAHILTQDINLNKLAPYRGLLGMNDKALEEEQAVRFVRVASR